MINVDKRDIVHCYHYLLQTARDSYFAQLPVSCRHVTSWQVLHSGCFTPHNTSDMAQNQCTLLNRKQ
jgi:hypothetical protein